MQWLFVVLAVIAEVIGALALKYSNGLTKLWPSVLMFIFFTLSVTLLSFAVKKMSVGVGYAIWTGSGTAIIALLGILLFNENISVLKFISIVLIIAGVIGLNLSGLKH